MTQTINQLQNRIMRRIYMAFGLRIALHPLTLLSVVALACLYVLARLVFVARVWQGFAHTPTTNMPAHALAILTHADMPTLLVTASLAVVGIAILRQVAHLASSYAVSNHIVAAG